MKKILFVTHSLTPDKRIDQEAQSLMNAGFEVFLICRGKKKDKTPNFYKEIFIVNLNRGQLAYFPNAVRKARKKYKKIIDEIKPNFIHANDLPVANIVRKIIPEKVKFIYDDHEVWDLHYKLYADRTVNWLKKIQRRYLQFMAKILSKKIMKQADLVIFVNEYWVEYYTKKGIDSTKIISIENFPLKQDIDSAQNSEDQIDEFFEKDPRRKIVTASKFEKLSDVTLRNSNQIVKAVNELDEWVIVNFGISDEEYEKLGVISIGFKPRFEFIKSCSKCDIILNPLVLDELMHYSSPNRFFEAALLGVRIISSKAKTLVDKFDDLIIWINPNAPIEEIKEILRNIDSYPSGVEIKKAAMKYTWEKEEKKLITKYMEFSV